MTLIDLKQLKSLVWLSSDEGS